MKDEIKMKNWKFKLRRGIQATIKNRQKYGEAWQSHMPH